MIVGSFAGKNFEVSFNKVYTIDGLTYSTNLNIEEQEVEGDKPSTYIKGMGLSEAKFSIKLLKQRSLNVQNDIKDWENIKNARIPYMLIIGGSPICYNKMLLTNVSVDSVVHDAYGEIIRANLSLEFKEFVRWGAKKDNTSGGKGRGRGGAKTSSKKGKKGKKRKNSNAKTAMTSSQEAQVAALETEIFGG